MAEESSVMARSDSTRSAFNGDASSGDSRSRVRGALKLDPATTLRLLKIEEDIDSDKMKLVPRQEVIELISIIRQNIAERKYGV
jgi:hypothetical protein